MMLQLFKTFCPFPFCNYHQTYSISFWVFSILAKMNLMPKVHKGAGLKIKYDCKAVRKVGGLLCEWNWL